VGGEAGMEVSTASGTDGVAMYTATTSASGGNSWSWGLSTHFSNNFILSNTGTSGGLDNPKVFEVTNGTQDIEFYKIILHRATAKVSSTLGSTSGTIAIDAAVSDFYKVTLTGNATLANPTNSGSTNVRHFTVRVKQDATGSRTLGYGTDYRFPAGIVPDLTTAPNAVDYLSFILDEDADKWDFVGNAFNLLPAGT
jgi:hypothetical protein